MSDNDVLGRVQPLEPDEIRRGIGIARPGDLPLPNMRSLDDILSSVWTDPAVLARHEPQVPLSQASVPPLDIRADGLAGGAQQLRGQTSRGGLNDMTAMMALLPIAFAKGGRAGAAAFLQGMQQSKARRRAAEAERAAQERQVRLDSRQERVDRENADYRQQQLMLDAEGRRQADERARESARSQFLERFDTSASQITDPSAYQYFLQLQYPEADRLGIPRGELDARVMQAHKPSEVQQREAQRIIRDLETRHGNNWYALAKNFVFRVSGQEQPVALDDVMARAGMVRTAPDSPVTRIDPAVALDRQLAAAMAAGDTELANQIEGAMRRAAAAGRAPQSSGDGAPTRTDRLRGLDEQVAFLLRNPDRASRQRWGAIRSGYEALGVVFDARRDSIARDAARQDQLLGGVTAPEDLLAGAEDFEDAPTPPPTTPAPGRAGGPPAATGRTATAAEVQAVARSMGISEAEARRRLQAQGVTLTR